jgi:hypothetical protein
MLLSSTRFAGETPPDDADTLIASGAVGNRSPQPVPSLPVPVPAASATLAPLAVPELDVRSAPDGPAEPDEPVATTRPVPLDALTAIEPTAAGWASVSWALAPLVTLGVAAPFSFAYAAVRQRRRRLVAFTALYAGLVGTAVALAASEGPASGLPVPALTFALLVALASTIHSLAIRRTVFAPVTPYRRLTRTSQERMRRREESRRILTADPELAASLHIGRPDLPREYDDGGLVDVNHVPLRFLMRIEGIDESTARQITESREAIGGFASLDELCMTTGLWPQDIGAASVRLVFIR